MSWLSDLASRAEGLLDHLDQSTGAVLQKTKSQNRLNVSLNDAPLESVEVQDISAARKGPESVAGNFAAPVSKEEEESHAKPHGYASSVIGVTQSRVSTPAPRRVDQDEDLLNFLNSPNDVAVPSTSQQAAVFSAARSRRSSSSSLRSASAVKKINETTESSPTKAPISEVATFASYSAADKLKELELNKQLQARDAQVAVLRVKVQELSDVAEKRAKALLQLQREHEKLTSQIESSNTTEQSTSLQSKIIDLEARIDHDKKDARRLENDHMVALQKCEDKIGSLSQEVMSLQKSVTEERLKGRDAFDQLKLAKYNLEANKSEFDEYKQKAQRILQSKEALIETLKAGVSVEESMQTEIQVQLTEVSHERDLLREDLQQSQVIQYNLRTEMQELETQLAAEQRRSLENQRELQDQLQQLQLNLGQYREQAEHARLENNRLRDEMQHHQSQLLAKLQQKDVEIERLTGQIAERRTAANESQSETRIRSLTESLIQKQSIIEALQAEQRGMTLQLERVEGMYREAETAAVQNATASSLASAEEGLVQRLPTFLRESAFDSPVTKGMKRAYGTIDIISARLGIFLRRYPFARIGVVIYVMLLHLWVMFVLLTYSPEMHSVHDFRSAGPVMPSMPSQQRNEPLRK